MVFPVFLWFGSLRGLPGRLLYPVSRARRATVAYLSAMSFTVVFVSVTAGVTYLLYALKPFAGMMDEAPVLDPPLLPLIGILAVWCPVASGLALRPPISEPLERARFRTGAETVAILGGTLLYALCAGLSLYAHSSLLATLAPLYQSLVFAGVAALTHSIYLVVLYRSYAARDLV